MALDITGLITSIPSLLKGGENNALSITLIVFTLLIVVYSLLIFYFYKFLAKKNIIELNLAQYNLSKNAALEKFFAVVLYIAEYLIFLPIVTFIWFAVSSVLILLLAEGMEISTVLLISSALVAAVRVTSYIDNNLSRDLAKMLPFTLLAIAVTRPGFFNVASLVERMAGVPTLFSDIIGYLIFIVAIELIMRIFDMIKNAFTNKEGELGTQTEEEEK